MYSVDVQWVASMTARSTESGCAVLTMIVFHSNQVLVDCGTMEVQPVVGLARTNPWFQLGVAVDEIAIYLSTWSDPQLGPVEIAPLAVTIFYGLRPSIGEPEPYGERPLGFPVHELQYEPLPIQVKTRQAGFLPTAPQSI